MATWKTLHIFGFGDVQVIVEKGDGATKKSVDLKKLQPVIDNIWSLKTEDAVTKEYHAINIFSGMFADWQPKEQKEKGYRVQFDKLDKPVIEALIKELLAK